MPGFFVGTRSEPDLEASREALDEGFRNGKLSQEAFNGQLLLLQRSQFRQFAIDTRNERGKITFHSLRHATATAAIANGANVRTLSSLLGHANPQITLTIYAVQWAARLDQATAIDTAGVLFGSQTVAPSPNGSTADVGASVETAGNPEAYNGGPCRDRALIASL